MSCHFDRDTAEYRTPDGELCKRDDYGDPTYHCTARRTCSQHIGARELTCARCIGRARRDVAVIRDLAPLMLPVALGAGVNSEAAMLAGPACDVEAWSWRKVAAMRGGPWHASLTEDDDDQHPYTVLTRWQMMLSEDYGHEMPEQLSTTGSAEYLDRHLGRIAQDDGQDFALLAREVRRCRIHLEAVLVDSGRKERGAPCPECANESLAVRLVREYGHHCEDPECDRLDYIDDSGDKWICPRNYLHTWSEKDYRNWVEERQVKPDEVGA